MFNFSILAVGRAIAGDVRYEKVYFIRFPIRDISCGREE
jgi:hypothetical protein